MSAVRCPLLLKIATFSLKDSARTLSICLPLRSLALAKTKLENKFDCKYIANKFYRLNGISCGFLRFIPVKCDMWRLCLAGRYLDLCIVKMTPCPALLSSMGRGGAHGCNPISYSLYAADSIFAAPQICSTLGKYIRIVALFVIIYKIYSV